MQILTGDLFGQIMVFAVLATAIAALVYAYSLARQILAHDKGTPAMQQIWGDIKAGANAYLTTQFSRLIPAVVGLAILMFLSVYLVKPTPEALEMADVYHADPTILVGVARMLAFILGASFSAGVGYLGMNMAVEGNVRVASAARTSYHEALKIAYRSGTITGMLTDGLGLLGGTTIFLIFAKASPDVLLGFGFGGTLLALFMRVGGGIFTKAADVGADLVGKVEAGMEEDDPRNAAVIADLVGDNVGDCAGMAADIFESYEVTIVASFILGLALYHLTGHVNWIIVPLIIRGVGVISTIIGTYAVSLWKTNDAETAMFRSYELSSVITITASLAVSALYGNDIRMGVLVAIGVALAVIINPLTAYATSANSPRVQHIAASTKFGPALVILEGISLGYLSSVWSVLVIILSLSAAILLYSVDLPGLASGTSMLPWAAAAIAVMVFLYMAVIKRKLMDGIFYAMWVMVGGFFLASMHSVGVNTPGLLRPEAITPTLTDASVKFSFILFGVSLIGVGMLSLTGNNVSMDAFGPIADNANGIGEVAGMDPAARQVMADLDAAGNTTKAITKGVAIGSAVIAALSLYGAFFADIERVWPAERGPFEAVINLSQPTVFIGLLIGGMLPLLFGSLLIKAVNRSAAQIMSEVRRQLRIPEIWSGKRRPDYTQAVTISTKSAQAELIPVGVIAVFAPIVVGLLLKEQALGGFLAGVILSGQLQAVFMANAGGAWDNAKKFIEDGNFGGKGSENHKASVVGDTVGDPFKDTAGPALNPMIKVMNLVSLIMAPIVVQFTDFSLGIIVTIVVGILAILWAVRRSDRQVDLTGEGEALTMATAGGGSVSASEMSAQTSKPAPKKASGRTPAKKPAARKK